HRTRNAPRSVLGIAGRSRARRRTVMAFALRLCSETPPDEVSEEHVWLGSSVSRSKGCASAKQQGPSAKQCRREKEQGSREWLPLCPWHFDFVWNLDLGFWHFLYSGGF